MEKYKVIFVNKQGRQYESFVYCLESYAIEAAYRKMLAACKTNGDFRDINFHNMSEITRISENGETFYQALAADHQYQPTTGGNNEPRHDRAVVTESPNFSRFKKWLYHNTIKGFEKLRLFAASLSDF